MSFNRILVSLLSIFLILSLFCPATAQMRKISKFKKVEIPFNLKHEDSIFEQGKFDFEILSHRSLNMFQLKIIKSGDTLCILSGKILREICPGARGEEKNEVPDDPTLKMKRIPAKKILYIIFDNGKLTEVFPCLMLRFKMEYE